MPNLTVWLIASALLFACGLLAALVDRRASATLCGTIIALAAAVLALAALVRFAVLPLATLATLLLMIALGSVLVLVAAVMAAAEDAS